MKGERATVLLFDDDERFQSLLDWARAHDTLVCVVSNPEFGAVIAQAMEMDMPPDVDILALNGGVVELSLPFVVEN